MLSFGENISKIFNACILPVLRLIAHKPNATELKNNCNMLMALIAWNKNAKLPPLLQDAADVKDLISKYQAGSFIALDAIQCFISSMVDEYMGSQLTHVNVQQTMNNTNFQ